MKRSLLIALCGVLLSPPLDAQSPDALPASAWAPISDVSEMVDWTDEIPAHVTVVDDQAWHERDGLAEPAEANVALLAGDRLRTGRGRLEVLFADGSALALDELTDVELLSDSLLRLGAGRVRLTLARGSTTALDYRVDAAGTTAWIRTAGEYEVSLGSPGGPAADLRLTVMRGLAELSSPHGRTLVQAGHEAVANSLAAPSLPYAASVSGRDSFARWVNEQHEARVGYRSAQYLPRDIRHYSGVLDRHGDWLYDRSYGYVWYPTVSAAWRPYYDGHWSFVGSFGWFWVGASRWSWPTHHYGRWGQTSGRWYWIPDRRWAPAWVSWASAPGYVGWAPLGFNNRPIVSISLTTVHAWNTWTVAPVRSFRAKVAVPRYALSTRAASLPRDLRFETRQTAPIRPATLRTASRPLRAPTVAAVTRSAAPRVPPTQDAAVGVPPVGASAGAPHRGIAPARATPAGVAGRSVADPARATRQAGPRTSGAPRVSDAPVPSRTPPRASGAPPAAGAPRTSGAPRTAPGVSSAPRTPEANSRQAAPRTSGAPRTAPSAPRAAPGPSPDPPARAPQGRVGSAPPQRAPQTSAPPPSQSSPAPRAEPGSSNGRTAPTSSGGARRAAPRAR